MLALGAMLLLWAHIILLAELLLSMHRHKAWRVRMRPGGGTAAGDFGAGGDGSSGSLSLELGPGGSVELAKCDDAGEGALATAMA